MWGWIALASVAIGIFVVSKTPKDLYRMCSGIYHVASFSLIKDFIVFKTRLMFQELSDCGKYTVGNKNCEVIFYDGSRRFRICFPRKRGPCEIVKIFTPTSIGNFHTKLQKTVEDVTDKVLEYMGPCHNFYGILITPKILGYNRGLMFEMLDGEIKPFTEKEIIDL